MNAAPDGRIAPERIRMMATTPLPPAGAVERCNAIDGGIAVPDISRATYGEK